MPTLQQLKFPVGEFKATEKPGQQTIDSWIQIIANFSSDLRQKVNGLNDQQLAVPYRPGGWNIRQVVHHCADSHMNAFIRFKLALTEDRPTIKPYAEAAWAELPDTLLTPLAPSLNILDGLHTRWTILLQGLSEADFKKEFLHPEQGKPFSLLLTLDSYQWHCRHHLAHVQQALK